MKLQALGLGLILTLGSSLVMALEAQTPRTLDVWPGPAPGETGSIGEEQAKKKADGTTITNLTNVTKPTITLYRPDASKNSGAAILVCPGGGYRNLAWDHEGEQVARWLNQIGITAALLKYRVPRREGTPEDQPPPQALMDAQRALSLLRSNAADWGIDAKRIGILGFSAGGHLGAWTSTNFDHRGYEPIDAVDRVDCRPDFAALIYSGGVIKKGASELTPEIRVTSQTPPMFLVHASNDNVSPENSVQLYLALKRAGVPAEMHLYATGGHGFGMRSSEHPSSTWPQRCEDWLRSQGILKAEKTR
ncbi:alpha/beta hydrolase [Singulisphaera acidiphila]|uniref:Esterase/lipase n=1 Tax=Singulisphaera acidiphila (strain ATCC BAA-1392 / DSM 18658 / VKM B-2454 / MOB10) TaxID=886293 RepID=L0DNP1_SINAD|nr:alpha/beta hydrolase [Singulisphaera acidiphila]AGA30989.1 esterase/lipase [Singulisphaera acidiphila DSM 18658]